MQLDITSKNIELTPSLRKFIQNKCKKLEHYFEHINRIHVVLNVEKLSHLAEATLHINGGELHASVEQLDMYVAIDILIDKLVRQLNKYKDKLRRH